MGRGAKKSGLQDLVLGNLVDEEEKTEEGFQILAESYEESSVLFVVSAGRDTESLLLKDPTHDEVLQAVGRQAALYLSLGRAAHHARSEIRPGIRYSSYSSHHPGVNLSLMLLEYLNDPSDEGLKELHGFIKHLNNQIEMHDILFSSQAKLDFIQDHFDEQALVVVSEATGAKESTVKKWFDGSNPSSYNDARLGLLVKVLYQLQAGAGMSQDEAIDWYMSANAKFSGESPHDIMQREKSYWSIPSEVAEEVKLLGGDFS